MAQHLLTPTSISDNEVANTIENVATSYLEKQSWFKAHQSTLLAVANGVLQLANVGVFFLAGQDYPEWIVILIGVIISAAQAIAHSSTSAPISVRNATKLAEFAADDNPDAVPAAPTVADYYEGR